MTYKITQKYIERFWSKVKKTDTCWIWKGTIIRNYGQYAVNLDRYRPHRFVWILEHGKIPKGKMILHKCDNGLCCRKDHLYIGTHAQNMRDRMIRGRTTHGEETFGAKLNSNLVKKMWKMREQGYNTYQIWKEIPIKVGYGTIKNVFRRHTWNHVN